MVSGQRWYRSPTGLETITGLETPQSKDLRKRFYRPYHDMLEIPLNNTESPTSFALIIFIIKEKLEKVLF